MAQAQQITILIPDPDEMMFVAGQNEANIDRIEREFGVRIVARGAELRISGDPSSVSRVGDLVGAMRSLSGRDDNLRRPALERLIGDAKEAPVATPQQLRDHVATTITGKRITPQSDNQRRYVEAMRGKDLVFATGPAGTGKCIAADSLVLTDRGMVKIGQLGDGLDDGEMRPIELTVHGVDEAEPASLVYSGGVSQTLAITTRFGYRIETTPEHPLLVRIEPGVFEWRHADELKSGDMLALQRGQRMFGTCTRVDFSHSRNGPHDHSNEVHLKALDEKIGYFLGILTGDGCVTARNRISLSNVEPEVIDAFKSVAHRFGLNVFLNYNAGYSDTDQPDRVIASSQLYALLRHIGMSMTTAPHKTIPSSILAAPEPIVRAFLRGLFDTDGGVERDNVISLTLTSAVLITQVQTVLLNFGIVSTQGIKRGRYLGRPHISYRLVIAGAEAQKFAELIGFAVQRKCSLLPAARRNPNVDVIPHAGPAIDAAVRAAKWSRAEHKVFQDYRWERRHPSYAKLAQLVSLLEPRVTSDVLMPLQEVLDRQLLFLEVTSITPSRARVYDLTVPATHSFVANGFINHNSFLAVAMGVNALRERKVTRLILTRPAVEAGERLGFLPGDLEQKIDPYLRPLYDALYELMPAERFARAQERGEIEVAPLGFMRGRTLNEAFIILDEAQNTTAAQMKMFLTRLGYGSQAVVNGDITQVDLAKGQRSGLVMAREILREVEGIAFVDFDDKDVVRHELVARIVRAYDRYERSSE